LRTAVRVIPLSGSSALARSPSTSAADSTLGFAKRAPVRSAISARSASYRRSVPGSVQQHAIVAKTGTSATAKLARFLGVQFRLYESINDKTGKGRLGADRMEMRLGRAHLGAARVPDTNEVQVPTGVGLEPGDPFLFVWTPEKHGVHCIITGRELDVEADGIVG